VMRDIDGLATVAPPAPVVAVPLAPEAVRGLLADLERALKYDLGGAEPVLARLRAAAAGTPLATEIGAIAALVDVFDIDAALAQLHKLEASDRVKTQ